ncbi:MAG: 8-oxo-dGTP diphosphatase [Candidatus Micrarchaeota archaeon]|nr:8-oxo-dGTP diphosphatase [Candidatus Micrarchaeota archaeon]
MIFLYPDAAVCYIIDEKAGRMLLKKNVRGISKGKWNGAGGKIEPGETPEQGAVREVFEETGLRVTNLFDHGVIRFAVDGSEEINLVMHVFSTRDFSGNPVGNEEGEVRWFGLDEIPYDRMWEDDIYWVDLMLNGRRFECEFHFDSGNRNLTYHDVRLK